MLLRIQQRSRSNRFTPRVPGHLNQSDEKSDQPGILGLDDPFKFVTFIDQITSLDNLIIPGQFRSIFNEK